MDDTKEDADQVERENTDIVPKTQPAEQAVTQVSTEPTADYPGPNTALVPTEPFDSTEKTTGFITLKGETLFQEKDRLLAKHHEKNGSLVQQIQGNRLSTEAAMNLIVVELFKETESLKGNELLFANDGNLRDATTVQVKRVEALEKTAKAIHRKHQMIAEDTINLDSPYIRLIITWLLRKMQETFVELGYDQEMTEIFFNRYMAKTDEWKKELKREIIAFHERSQLEDLEETQEEK
jgi:hypothetical protein